MRQRALSIIAASAIILHFGVVPAQALTTLLGIAPAVRTTLDQGKITLIPPSTNSPGKMSVIIENPAVARAEGLTVTLLAVGNTPITFVQEASGVYKSATRTTRLYVLAGTPVIGAWANQSTQLSAGTYRLTPPVSPSNGSWSYISSNLSVASVAGDLVTLFDGGSTVITAVQSATSSWLSTSISMTLSILAPVPVFTPINNISLSINSVSTIEIKDPISTSQGIWSYTSSNPAVATIVGKKITALTPGTVTISARQSRWQIYRSHETSFTVTIEAIKADVVSGRFVDTTLTLSSTSQAFTLGLPQSSSPGVWSVTSSDATVVAVGAITAAKEVLLTAFKPGTITLSAIQAASGTFGQSQPVAIKVSVNSVPVTAKLANIERVAGDPALAITFPTSQSKGAWSASSSASKVANLVNGTITFGDAGVAVITITQAVDGNWLSASSTFEVRVIGQTPTLGAASQIVLAIGEGAEVKSFPASNSSGKWIITSDNPAIASVVDGELIGVAAGTTEVTAFQDLAGKYGRSNIVKVSVKVKPIPKFDVLPNLTLVLGSSPVLITFPTSSSPGAWVFSSSNSAVVSVTGNRITAIGAGSASVVAQQIATADFSAVTQTFSVAINLPPAPKATAIASGRKITVNISNASASQTVVTINGAKAKVGVNSVGPGTRNVVVKILGKTVLTKKILIK